MTQQQTAALKAWAVQDSSQEWTEIVYATSRNQARHHGACSYDGEYHDMSARRAARWDHLAPKGPTHAQLFEAGWWMSCEGCEGMATKASGAVVDARGRFWCEECNLQRCEVSRHSPDAPSGEAA